MWITEYIAKVNKYVINHIFAGSLKNKKSRIIPIGKGTKIINQIGAFKISVIAPNETTVAPIIRA